MPAERIFRHRRGIEVAGNLDVKQRHPQLAEQSAHAEQHAPCVISGDKNHRLFARQNADLIPLGTR